MEHTKLEITLKDYLEGKFSEVHQKLNNLETLRQEEHDIVISMARDIAYRSDEIDEIKKNATQCKIDCMKRKEDFDQRVISIVDPRITERITRLKMWIATAIIVLMVSIAGYVVDKWVISPVQGHIEKTR
jgi:t-SNARE complex subunit (syntaxin)